MSDPNFIVLRCPFNLLRIFKDGAHRSKTEFMLGPGSDVKLTSDTDISRPPSMRLQRLTRMHGLHYGEIRFTSMDAIFKRS